MARSQIAHQQASILQNHRQIPGQESNCALALSGKLQGLEQVLSPQLRKAPIIIWQTFVVPGQNAGCRFTLRLLQRNRDLSVTDRGQLQMLDGKDLPDEIANPFTVGQNDIELICPNRLNQCACGFVLRQNQRVEDVTNDQGVFWAEGFKYVISRLFSAFRFT